MISNNPNTALLSIPFYAVRDWTTMSKFNIQGCLQVFDIIVHLNFLLVGIYFIYHGESSQDSWGEELSLQNLKKALLRSQQFWLTLHSRETGTHKGSISREIYDLINVFHV